MSRLFVAVGEGASDLDPEAALRSAEGVPPDRVGIFREPGLVVGVAARFTEPEDEGVDPIVVTDDIVFCIDGRLDARASLAVKLGARDSLPTACLALEAVRRSGRDAAHEVLGDFAWVAIDRRSGVVRAARDRFGLRPLHFVEHGRMVAFASTDRLLFDVLDFPRTPDPEVIGWALVNAFVSQEGRCLYERVRTLPAGHELELVGGAVSMRRYFEPEPRSADPALSEGEHRERIVEALTLAVRDRIRGRHPIGAECSGGMDSATCILLAADALAAEGRPPPLLAHMRGTGFPSSDEARHAADVARLVGARLLISDGSASAFEPGAVPEIDLPDAFCSSSRELFPSMYAAGVRVVLTGDGSDEIQTDWGLSVEDALVRRDAAGTLRIAGVFDEPLSADRWNAVIRSVGRAVVPRTYLARRRARNAATSLPPWLSQRGRRFALDAIADLNERASAFAHPSPMRQSICNGLVNCPSFTWIGPTNHQFASFHGIDLSSPFLDIRVVQAFLALPSELRNTFEVTKSLHRKAFAARLPPGVLWRRPAANYTALFEAAYGKARDRWLSIAERSRLSDLGLVDRAAFHSAVEAGLEVGQLGFRLTNALRLESWLRTFS